MGGELFVYDAYGDVYRGTFGGSWVKDNTSDGPFPPPTQWLMYRAITADSDRVAVVDINGVVWVRNGPDSWESFGASGAAGIGELAIWGDYVVVSGTTSRIWDGTSWTDVPNGTDQGVWMIDSGVPLTRPVDQTFEIEEIIVIAKDVIKVKFNQPVAITDSLFNIDSYVISLVEGDHITTVKQVLPIVNGQNAETTSVYLELSPKITRSEPTFFLSIPSAGTGAEIPITEDTSTMLFSPAGEPIGEMSAEWVHYRTKVDSVVDSMASMYDVKLGSNMRSILQAITTSDEEIGGGRAIQIEPGLDVLYPISTPIEEDEVFALPRFTWTGVTTITIAKAPGEPQDPRVRLQDDVIYSFTGPQTFDPSVAGIGGLDTGVEAPDTWYYLYLVEDSNVLKIVGSVNPPSVGPTGYSLYRYIGPVLNDGSDLRKFHQVSNDEYHFEKGEASYEPSTIAALTKTVLHTPAAAFDISDQVPPETASAVYVTAQCQRNSTAGWSLFMQLFVSGNIDTVTTGNYSAQRHLTVRSIDSGGGNVDSHNLITAWIPLPPGVGHPEIGMSVDRDGGSALPANFFVRVAGFKDGYR
jgi:hypothetical protein